MKRKRPDRRASAKQVKFVPMANHGLGPEISKVWKIETRRRVAEIESGREPGIDGEHVMAELRRIVGR